MTTKKATKGKSKRRKPATKGKARQPRAQKHPRLPAAGRTIRREFKGKTYELKVTKDGFVLGDVKFRSLTAAVKAVTSYPSSSGPRFWLGTDATKGGAK